MNASARRTSAFFGGTLFLVLHTSASFAQVDDDYITLASALASPAMFDDKAAGDSQSDTAVMLRMELARQQLLGMNSVTGDVADVRADILDSLELCHQSMEKIRRLDEYVPDFAGIASKTLDATPGLYKGAKKQELTDNEKVAVVDLAMKGVEEIVGGIVNAYEASSERAEYQKRYSTTRAKVRTGLLKLCAARYKTVADAPGTVLTVDVDGSWNNTFTRDWVCLRNDYGRELTDCTIIVSLNGKNAESGKDEKDLHVHFIEKWPTGKWVYAIYPSRLASGIATNESVDAIESVEICMFSNECAKVVKHAYKGEQYDNDVKGYANKYVHEHLRGKWWIYDVHLLYDNGFNIIYDGSLNEFPSSFVTVRIAEGDRTKEKRWHVPGGKISSGALNNLYLSDESFNGWDPDKVEVTFEFPHSSYKHAKTWNRRK